MKNVHPAFYLFERNVTLVYYRRMAHVLCTSNYRDQPVFPIRIKKHRNNCEELACRFFMAQKADKMILKNKEE